MVGGAPLTGHSGEHPKEHLTRRAEAQEDPRFYRGGIFRQEPTVAQEERQTDDPDR